MKAFDETPPDQICKKVEDIMHSIRNPTRPEEHPFLTSPNEHFIYTRVQANYPDDLYNLAHEGHIVSGWIDEIYSFWAANAHTLFLFSWDINPSKIRSSQTPSPVICAGYINGYILAVYNTGISLFSFPDFKPLKTRYSVPMNINATVIKYGIAGCNDGSLRKITVNPRRCSVSISGYLTLSNDDPVVQIIRTQNYFATLTLKFNISLFSNPKLKRLAVFSEVPNILNIWCPYDDIIMAIDSNAILYTLQYQHYKLIEVSKCKLIDRRIFQTAAFYHGLLIAVDSDQPSYDTVLTARFGTFPVYTINRKLGGIHSIGNTTSDIKIFSSSGIYSITEKVTHNENEEIWRFCNTINKFFNTPVIDINSEYLTKQLRNFAESDFHHLSTLSNYVLTIIDDFNVVKGTRDEVLFSTVFLSDFFSPKRDDLFSKLRRISFEIRDKKQSEYGNPPEELEILIEKAKLGNQEAAFEALSIITSYTQLPPYYRSLCEFMRENCFYRELLECIILWANSVLTDEKALEFENSNFTQKEDKYSYHLRLCIYEQMDPFLRTAIGIKGQHKEEWRRCWPFVKESTDEKNAADALRDILNLSNNEVFQRYVLDFLEENCSPAKITEFTYPGMIQQMRKTKSTHLPTVLIKKGMINEAFDLFLDQATIGDDYKIEVGTQTIEEIEDEEEQNDDKKPENNGLSIVERIKLINKSLSLINNDEKALKLKKLAELLKDFLIEHPDEPQNLFSMDFYEISEILVNYNEFRLDLEVMKIFGEKRNSVLTSFLECASLEDVKNYVEKDPIFSQEEIADELYRLKGKDAFDFMFDCNLDNYYIFKVLCREFKNGKYREDVEFIKNILNRAGQINNAIRQDLATILCEIILELDSNNKIEEANLIRENQKHCFLDQNFTDKNDL